MNPLRELLKHGQSVWLDYIRRSLLTSGELQRLVEEDGLELASSLFRVRQEMQESQP